MIKVNPRSPPTVTANFIFYPGLLSFNKLYSQQSGKFFNVHKFCLITEIGKHYLFFYFLCRGDGYS